MIRLLELIDEMETDSPPQFHGQDRANLSWIRVSSQCSRVKGLDGPGRKIKRRQKVQLHLTGGDMSGT